MAQKDPKITAFLSLGSNMGDRMMYLSEAEKKLSGTRGIKILKCSKIYETEPWPGNAVSEAPEKEVGNHWYLNQVIKIETDSAPDKLLDIFHEIEAKLGRVRHGHYAPRTIDIDLLLYGDRLIETDTLTVPHPHLYDRQFVLVPLLEIEPGLKDPAGGKSLKFFLENISDEHKVIPYL